MQTAKKNYQMCLECVEKVTQLTNHTPGLGGHEYAWNINSASMHVKFYIDLLLNPQQKTIRFHSKTNDRGK